MRLLSKICKAQYIVPASYILQPELIHLGKPRYRGGFADVNDGEYLESVVAIKQLRTNEGDFDKAFKVSFIDLAYRRRSSYSPSRCVERQSLGGTCPMKTSCLCWEYLWMQSSAVSEF